MKKKIEVLDFQLIEIKYTKNSLYYKQVQFLETENREFFFN